MRSIAKAQPADHGVVGRFWYFTATRCSPLKYLPYCALWVASLQLLAARVFQDELQPSLFAYLRTVAGAFVLLLFLRVVDEIKDLDFDRVHNPERAFASGRVPVSDAPAYLFVCALAVVLLELGHVVPLCVSLAIMTYSVGLLFIDRRFPGFADSMFPNIALAVQLKTMLIAYVLLGVLEAEPNTWRSALPLIAAYLAAYLHWEISRKIQWPEVAKPGDRLYSSEAGVLGSFVIAAALLLSALGLVCLAVARGPHGAWGWIVVLPAVWLLPAAWQLYRTRDRRSSIGVFGLFAYLSFLILNLVRSSSSG